MPAKDFQKKGAATQKDTVRRKIAEAIAELRLQIKGKPAEDRKTITIEDVLRIPRVSKKTLGKKYHRDLLKTVETFLVEVNVGVRAKSDRKPPRKKISTVFRQNLVLAGLAEAVRYEKQREIDDLKAKLAVVTAERDVLKAPSKTSPPRRFRSQPSTQRKAA
jgi:hypothetical protein